MNYELEFDPRALKEWRKLDETVRHQFKKKLALALLKPPNTGNTPLGFRENCYKIKLRKLGYRLVYQVQQTRITVFVIAIGKRERTEVYARAKERI